eukprot:TRINITY_DN18426_c0_g1_i1.p1 TRINITY_DN18426_c0_g1~~TRINITY_DN18426_c0_g1_i1.p1  ORF type:complete len:1284 (+),score=376.51 TRINITY_DN18426_c0_g1_i1:78-3929(+)
MAAHPGAGQLPDAYHTVSSRPLKEGDWGARGKSAKQQWETALAQNCPVWQRGRDDREARLNADDPAGNVLKAMRQTRAAKKAVHAFRSHVATSKAKHQPPSPRLRYFTLHKGWGTPAAPKRGARLIPPAAVCSVPELQALQEQAEAAPAPRRVSLTSAWCPVTAPRPCPQRPARRSPENVPPASPLSHVWMDAAAAGPRHVLDAAPVHAVDFVRAAATKRRQEEGGALPPMAEKAQTSRPGTGRRRPSRVPSAKPRKSREVHSAGSRSRTASASPEQKVPPPTPPVTLLEKHQQNAAAKYNVEYWMRSGVRGWNREEAVKGVDAEQMQAAVARGPPDTWTADGTSVANRVVDLVPYLPRTGSSRSVRRTAVDGTSMASPTRSERSVTFTEAPASGGHGIDAHSMLSASVTTSHGTSDHTASPLPSRRKFRDQLSPLHVNAHPTPPSPSPPPSLGAQEEPPTPTAAGVENDQAAPARVPAPPPARARRPSTARCEYGPGAARRRVGEYITPAVRKYRQGSGRRRREQFVHKAGGMLEEVAADDVDPLPSQDSTAAASTPVDTRRAASSQPRAPTGLYELTSGIRHLRGNDVSTVSGTDQELLTGAGSTGGGVDWSGQGSPLQSLCGSPRASPRPGARGIWEQLREDGREGAAEVKPPSPLDTSLTMGFVLRGHLYGKERGSQASLTSSGRQVRKKSRGSRLLSVRDFGSGRPERLVTRAEVWNRAAQQAILSVDGAAGVEDEFLGTVHTVISAAPAPRWSPALAAATSPGLSAISPTEDPDLERVDTPVADPLHILREDLSMPPPGSLKEHSMVQDMLLITDRPIPREFQDPVTGNLFFEPVLCAADNHMYEKSTIQEGEDLLVQGLHPEDTERYPPHWRNKPVGRRLLTGIKATWLLKGGVALEVDAATHAKLERWIKPLRVQLKMSLDRLLQVKGDSVSVTESVVDLLVGLVDIVLDDNVRGRVLADIHKGRTWHEVNVALTGVLAVRRRIERLQQTIDATQEDQAANALRVTRMLAGGDAGGGAAGYALTASTTVSPVHQQKHLMDKCIARWWYSHCLLTQLHVDLRELATQLQEAQYHLKLMWCEGRGNPSVEALVHEVPLVIFLPKPPAGDVQAALEYQPRRVAPLELCPPWQGGDSTWPDAPCRRDITSSQTVESVIGGESARGFAAGPTPHSRQSATEGATDSAPVTPFTYQPTVPASLFDNGDATSMSLASSFTIGEEWTHGMSLRAGRVLEATPQLTPQQQPQQEPPSPAPRLESPALTASVTLASTESLRGGFP